MPSIAVVGIQWGDEGKGKVVDALTAEADVVVRYGGAAIAEKEPLLRDVAPEAVDVARLMDSCRRWGSALWPEGGAPFVHDTTALLHAILRIGKRVLFEGAQGALLDVDFGTYPYVTS